MAKVTNLSERRAQKRAEQEREILSLVNSIALLLGVHRASQIHRTTTKLIKLGIPKEAVSVCVGHIIGLAFEDVDRSI